MTREVDPLLERIDQVLADELALAATTAPAPEIERTDATVERVMEYGRRLEEDVPKPLEKIKLTREQRDALVGDAPCPDSRYRYGGQLADLAGIPIELVDNPEKSDLWRMDVDQLRRKLADLGLVDLGSAREEDHKTVICSPVDEPRVSRAANGFLADVVASELVKLGQLMISISGPPPLALPVEPPCCNRHTERCEVPNDVCCEVCPRAVELAELVATHVPYVGFEESVEPRADQTRGWLARLFERWSR